MAGGAHPGSAQRVRQECTRSKYQPRAAVSVPAPSPDEARLDSIYTAFGAGIKQEARDEAAAAGVASPRGLLMFDRAQGSTSVQVQSHGTNFTVQPAMFTRAAELLAAYPASEAISRHLRLDSVPPSLQPVPRSNIKECMPSLANGSLVLTMMSRFLNANPDLVPYADGRTGVVIRLLATAEGDAAFPRIERSSGVPRLDTFAMLLANQLKFAPASFNDQKLDAYVTIPINFETPRQPARDPFTGAFPNPSPPPA
jgi:TonB family protein